MGNFNDRGGNGGGFRGGDHGGRPSFGGGNRGGSRGGDRGPVTMHKAVCDECHKSCEVPFRPSGDKPIYCSDCFSSKKGDDDRGPRRDFGGDSRAPRREFDRPAPSFSKPVAGAGDDMKNYFREINVKLDRLTSAIEKLVQGKGEAKSFMKVAPAVTKTPVTKTATKVASSAIRREGGKAVAVKAPAKKVAKKGKK